MMFGVQGALKVLKDRLTAARAGYLDYINTLNTRLSATWAGYLNTTKANVDTLISRLTSDRAGYLDNLDGFTPFVPVTEEKSGSLSIGVGSANVTVTSATAGKRFVIGTYSSQTPCTFEFTSTTNVQVARSVTDQLCNYKFTVIRWD